MVAAINDRGRGPEIVGTRVTVYRIMDFIRDGSSTAEMAAELNLTPEQVEAALEYIAAHQEEVAAGYEQIIGRIRKGNPAWVMEGAAKSIDELRQRILSRKPTAVNHERNGRQ